MNQNCFLTNHAPMAPSHQINQSGSDPGNQLSSSSSSFNSPGLRDQQLHHQHHHQSQSMSSQMKPQQQQYMRNLDNQHIQPVASSSSSNSSTSNTAFVSDNGNNPINFASLDLKSLSNVAGFNFSGLGLDRFSDLDPLSSLDASVYMNSSLSPSTSSSSPSSNPKNIIDPSSTNMSNVTIGSLDGMANLNQLSHNQMPNYSNISAAPSGMINQKFDQTTIQSDQTSTPTSSTNTTPISFNGFPTQQFSSNGLLKHPNNNHHFVKPSLAPSTPSINSNPNSAGSQLFQTYSNSTRLNDNIHKQLPPYIGVSLACELKIDPDLGEDRMLRRLQKREVKAINEIQTFRQEALDLCNLYATETGDMQWFRLMIMNNDFHHKTINDHLKTKQDAFLAAKLTLQNQQHGQNTHYNASFETPPQFKYLEDAREALKKVEIRDKRLEKLRVDFHDHVKGLGLADKIAPAPSSTHSMAFGSNMLPNHTSPDSIGVLQAQIPGGFLPSPAPSTNATSINGPLGLLGNNKKSGQITANSLEPLTPVASLTSMTSNGQVPMHIQSSQQPTRTTHPHHFQQQQHLGRQAQGMNLNTFSKDGSKNQANSPLQQQLTPTSMSSPLTGYASTQLKANKQQGQLRSQVQPNSFVPPNASRLPNLAMTNSSLNSGEAAWSNNNNFNTNNILRGNAGNNVGVGSGNIDTQNGLNLDSFDNLEDIEKLVGLNDLNNLNDLGNFNGFNNLEAINMINSLGSASNKPQTKNPNAINSNQSQNSNIVFSAPETHVSDITNFSSVAAVGNLTAFDGLNIDFSDFPSFTNPSSNTNTSPNSNPSPSSNINSNPSPNSNNSTINESPKVIENRGLNSSFQRHSNIPKPIITNKRPYDDVQSTPLFSPSAAPPMSHSASSTHQSPNYGSSPFPLSHPHPTTNSSSANTTSANSLKSTPVLSHKNPSQSLNLLQSQLHQHSQLFSKDSASPFGTLSPSSSEHPSPHTHHLLTSQAQSQSPGAQPPSQQLHHQQQQQLWNSALPNNSTPDSHNFNVNPDSLFTMSAAHQQQQQHSQNDNIPPIKKFHKLV